MKKPCKVCGDIFNYRPYRDSKSCSVICSTILRFGREPEKESELTCLACGLGFLRKKSKLTETGRAFCSKKCAAKLNLTFRKPPKKVSICSCGRQMHVKSIFCKECRKENFLNTKIGDLLNLMNHRSRVYGNIRANAREILHSEKERGVDTSCEECGYSKHVEVAHIKAISSFPLETQLRVVNARENLRFLCPNCHWEFDNLPH
jgi:5-methylcytosine-specific restriction endonuclease McrA